MNRGPSADGPCWPWWCFQLPRAALPGPVLTWNVCSQFQQLFVMDSHGSIALASPEYKIHFLKVLLGHLHPTQRVCEEHSNRHMEFSASFTMMCLGRGLPWKKCNKLRSLSWAMNCESWEDLVLLLFSLKIPALDTSEDEQIKFCFIRVAQGRRVLWLLKIRFIRHYLFVTVATLPKVFYWKRAFVIVSVWAQVGGSDMRMGRAGTLLPWPSVHLVCKRWSLFFPVPYLQTWQLERENDYLVWCSETPVRAF